MFASACGQLSGGTDAPASQRAEIVQTMPVQFRGRWVQDPIACLSRNRADTEIAATVIDFAGSMAQVKRVRVSQDKASVVLTPKDTQDREESILHLRAKDDNTLLARLGDGETGKLLRCR